MDPLLGRDRIYNMIHDRGDWCISRQRTWGVPIPIFYCLDCGQPIINDSTISHLQTLFREHGSQIWFAKEAMELIPRGSPATAAAALNLKKKRTSWMSGLIPAPAMWPCWKPGLN